MYEREGFYCDIFYLKLSVRYEEGHRRPKREKQLLLIKYSSLSRDTIIVSWYYYSRKNIAAQLTLIRKKSFTLLKLMLSYVVRNSASAALEKVF